MVAVRAQVGKGQRARLLGWFELLHYPVRLPGGHGGRTDLLIWEQASHVREAACIAQSAAAAVYDAVQHYSALLGCCCERCSADLARPHLSRACACMLCARVCACVGCIRWVGLYCFLLFNVGDWAGRLLAGWAASCGAALSNGITLRLLIFCRFGFLPLFMLCNHETTRLPVVFKHDAFPIGFMLLFALSNGYAGTVCMMTAPSLGE